MVEPPIKKADRKPKPETEAGNEVTNEVTAQSSPQKKSFTPPIKKDPKDRENENSRDRDRSKGRGRDKGRGR